MTKFRKIIFGLLLVLPITASAQVSVALVPAQIDKQFKPGQPFEMELQVMNDGPTPVNLHVYITDFWYNDKNEKTFTAAGQSPRSAANWIQFVPEQFVAAPRSTQRMKAIVTPPSDAKGGYYAVLFVESKPELSKAATKDSEAVFTNMRLGSLVLLNAENTAEYKIDISDAKLMPPGKNQQLNLAFKVHNQSNSHVFPFARLAILDSRQKLLGKAESQAKRFLPGQKDAMQIDWAGSLPPGNYTAVLTLVYGGNKVFTDQYPFLVAEQ
jgi:P pilus assembly chaperone PapD